MASRALDVALIGGPQYDALYTRLAEFTARTGYSVRVHVRLPHPELNAHLAEAYRTGHGPYDLISTHTKYAPAQAHFLRPLDDLLDPADLADFAPAILDLARVHGRLVQVPRNVDCRLLFVRRDLLADPHEQAAFVRRFGRPLGLPRTWLDLADVARFFARPPALFGYAFPGRQSGLFGTFFELHAMAGGVLFDEGLRPHFDTAAGHWALGLLRDLYLTWQTTPQPLESLYFDEVSALFRSGRAALVLDWPAYYGLYRDPATSQVIGRYDIAPYPVGPAGLRRVYAGCHSFAIPTSVKDLEGALALLRFLTAPESQRLEAERGAIVPRQSVMQALRATLPPDSLEARRLALLDEIQRDQMLTFPKFAAYPAVEEAVAPLLQQAIRGECAVATALARADEVAWTLIRQAGEGQP